MGFGSLAVFDELNLQPTDYVELALLFVLVYAFLRFLRTTIAGSVFRGAALPFWILVLGAVLAIRKFELEVVQKVLMTAMLPLAIALVVTFQTELRHGIARFGGSRWFRGLFQRDKRARKIRAVDEIVNAVATFAEESVGALIGVERAIDLGTYIESGVPMDALIRAETLDTIFSTHTALHDGAVVIRRNRIASAGCLFPLTDDPALARKYGTRHRAAIGLSEQSDAVIIVVSEERGHVHVAEKGELVRYTDLEWLRAYLNVVFAESQGIAPTDIEA